ncbi:MAG: hypothetical protein E6Q88_14065 [Lysobacteraceae bacterium]|nr:MAG: hypothetical protein E6Q88_14065 [Xanthomonadaceae bacterium]
MSRTVNHLGVPPMDLTITDAGNGKLKVELQVPRSSGSLDNIPFLEVTRNEQQTLLNGARQDIISRLSQSGLQIGEVKWEAGANQQTGGTVGGGANVPKLGKVTFEITAGNEYNGNVSGSLRNNPDIAGAIREAERNFDTRRQDIYESRAREWHRNGGATLTSDGETYTVTQDAAKNYINQRHPLNPFKRVSADDLDGVEIARVGGAGLVPGNESLNRQFEQALKATNGDRDQAALAVQTISQTPGYKPDADIRVVQGTNGGMIVSQGEGPTGLNAAVPQAKQGDFERVAAQMTQTPPATEIAAVRQDQPERARAM